MLGLPASTEIRKVITKKKVYDQFGADMSTEQRRKFDADIARMVLTNEVSPVSINLPAGDDVQNFFVLQVVLKARTFDPQSIAFIARMFGQRLLMALEAEGQQRIAVWQNKLIMTEWAAPGALEVSLDGLDLDKVWSNIVAGIAGLDMQPDKPLDEQLALAARREKLQKEIARLEKKAWAEKQPKKKFELVQQKRALEQKLEEIDNG